MIFRLFQLFHIFEATQFSEIFLTLFKGLFHYLYIYTYIYICHATCSTKDLNNITQDLVTIKTQYIAFEKMYNLSYRSYNSIHKSYCKGHNCSNSTLASQDSKEHPHYAWLSLWHQRLLQAVADAERSSSALARCWVWVDLWWNISSEMKWRFPKNGGTP